MAEPSIMDESLTELLALFRTAGEKVPASARPPVLLIGGWAVHAYNPYFGSTDIDIVTTSELRKRLITGLRKRGFSYRKDEFEDRRLCKRTGAGPIAVDFFNSKTDYRFEGRREAMRFESLYEGWQPVEIRGAAIPVPSRTALLVTKMKAAWDRSWRIESSKTIDLAYESRKLIKDQSDIVALIDPAKGGRTLDLGRLAGFLERHGFLKKVLQGAAGSPSAAELYGMDPHEMRRIVDGLASLL